MSKIVQSSNLRNHLADVLDALSDKEKYFLIARNQQINAALVDIEFFEELLEALSPEYRKSIRQARDDFAKGQVHSHAEVFGKL